MNQKGHTLLIVLLIAAVMVGYLVYSGKINLYKTQIPSATPSTTISDNTANWKTYTNTKYGYQLQYPQDWVHSALDKPDKDTLDSQCLGKNLSKCILNISILDGNSWERQKQLLGLTLSSKEGTKEISFADSTGLKRIGYFGETGSLYGFILILNHNGKVYKIWAYQKTEDRIDFTSNIDQILSTFKFLDQSQQDTSNWKTYKNNEFSFQYPSSWYSEKTPGFGEGNNVEFFLVGTKADHGYGDHQGNEVFVFVLSDDTRSLGELKKNYYPTATEVTVSGKPALKTSFNLFIIKISATKELNIVGGREGGKKNIEQILSTLKFTN